MIYLALVWTTFAAAFLALGAWVFALALWTIRKGNP